MAEALLQRREVGDQPVGHRRQAGGVAIAEERVFDAVKAGEAGIGLTRGEIFGHRIDGVGEVGEAVGDRLDALVGKAGGRVERPRPIEIAGMDRRRQVRGGAHHRGALQDQIDLVFRQRADEGAERPASCRAGPWRLSAVTCRPPRGLESRPQVMS